MKSFLMKSVLALILVAMVLAGITIAFKALSFSLHAAAFTVVAVLLAGSGIMVWDWNLRRKRRRG